MCMSHKQDTTLIWVKTISKFSKHQVYIPENTTISYNRPAHGAHKNRHKSTREQTGKPLNLLPLMRSQTEQAALVRAAWSGSTLFAYANMIIYDPTLVDLTSKIFFPCTNMKISLNDYS